MAGNLRARKRRDVGDGGGSKESSGGDALSSDLEVYSKEVLSSLIKDNLPPTPNNFSLYFDKLLEDKSENLRKQIISIIELEESNDDETTIMLEQSLKKGFSSVKNILGVTANLYKNMTLMTRILEKRREELDGLSDSESARSVVSSLDGDLSKLNVILKKQNSQMKDIYDETANIVKSVENETIFDNQYGVYNKRYLLAKIKQEIGLITEFKHSSSLMMIELSRELKESVNNDKAVTLMTRTIARLLLKTSRRNDVVSHYGNGVFAMLVKYTDIPSSEKASERLVELVSNSNFFLADREVQLKIAIGITDVNTDYSVEEIIVSAMDGIEKSYLNPKVDFAVSQRPKVEEKK
jgi:diguanylate cyclase (GGDEF)-like protein